MLQQQRRRGVRRRRRGDQAIEEQDHQEDARNVSKEVNVNVMMETNSRSRLSEGREPIRDKAEESISDVRVGCGIEEEED